MEEKKENHTVQVEIKDKLLLSINEAAAYSGIGQVKLRNLIKDQKNDFSLYVGKKVMIKRKQFEQFIDKNIEI